MGRWPRCHHLIDGEAGGLLPGRVLGERLQELADDLLRRDKQECVVDHPVPVGKRSGTSGSRQTGGQGFEPVQPDERPSPASSRGRRTFTGI